MTLAELIEEGERLSDPNFTGPNRQRDLFWDEHGPRLLAVARAAVEMKRASDAAWPILRQGPGGTMEEIAAETRLLEAERAFDAVAKSGKLDDRCDCGASLLSGRCSGTCDKDE